MGNHVSDRSDIKIWDSWHRVAFFLFFFNLTLLYSPVAQMVKYLPVMQETQVQSLDREDSLEKGMAIHSSNLAWRILWTEEPGRLQYVGSQRRNTTEQVTLWLFKIIVAIFSQYHEIFHSLLTLSKLWLHIAVLCSVVPTLWDSIDCSQGGLMVKNLPANDFKIMWLQFISVQSLSCVRFFVTPWTAAPQASLSITNSQSLPKLMSIESVMPSNYLILSSPSPPTLNLSQHQGLFRWVSSSHQVVKVLEFQLQHQSFQWIFRTDFL